MAFNDLLSSSFLFSIAIIIILIGGIFAYVSYRMSEQDHKITSMLGLISTMADELQFFRSRTERVEREERQDRTDNIMISPVLDPNNLVPIVSNYPTLISVSDDESESDSESESESESGSEDDDQSEESESEDDDQEDDDQGEEEEDDLTKDVLNLEGEHETLDLEELEDLNRDETIKSIHLETPIDLNISKEEEQSVDELFVGDLKTISIMDLEESNKKPDYKKMSLNKLREVVVEKGLIVDASKMKKPELLKLLGDE
jgi:hypothetical protein